MIDFRPQAIAYLSTPPDSFWHWADHGEVLAWKDGTTIAFRAEIEAVLTALAPDGLPHFNAVVILLAACRGKIPTAGVPVPPSLAGRAAKLLTGRANAQPAGGDVTEALARLTEISKLAPELTASQKSKVMLVEAVFDASERILNGSAVQAVLDGLREGLTDEELNQPNYFQPPGFQARHLDLLRRGLEKHDYESLRTRLLTGLDEVVQPADLELKPAARVRHLIQDLQNDPEHAGLARAVRDIMAAIYLPRSLSETDELSLGGFSDIANRGNFDRLLVSELAHDDLTLSVRIALNEALYIRREPPANHPPSGFAILVDSGIRTWGVPRVFATSVAMAFIAREDRQDVVAAFRATPEEAVPIDLCSKAGLLAHLGALETQAHPGRAMARFLHDLGPDSEVEAVVVIHRDSLADPDFQTVLSGLDCAPFYIATVDREGRFELYAHPRRATPLCRATIDLAGLFPNQAARKRPLIDARRDPNLPLILSIRPFPFLLPVHGKIDKAIRTPDGGGVAVMRDRRLLRWARTGEGTQMLCPQLTKGTTLWMHYDANEKVRVLKHRAHGNVAVLNTVEPESSELGAMELPLTRSPLWLHVEDDILFAVSRSLVETFNLNTGRAVGTLTIPMPRLQATSRYFPHAQDKWCFLSFDGIKAGWEPVTLPANVSAGDALLLFDRPGYEGPWMLTTTGQVFSNTGERIINLGRNLASAQVSNDGERILVNGIGGVPHQLIHLETRVCPAVSKQDASRLLNPPVTPPTRNLRLYFDAICLGGDAGLRLQSARGQWWDLHTESGFWLTPLADPAGKVYGARLFESTPVASDAGYTLKVAKWNDGTRAYLDSRGMLHLKSSDSSTPEVSLVLADGEIPVWSSDGYIHGPQFFIGDQTASSASLLLEKLSAFKRVIA